MARFRPEGIVRRSLSTTVYAKCRVASRGSVRSHPGCHPPRAHPLPRLQACPWDKSVAGWQNRSAPIVACSLKHGTMIETLGCITSQALGPRPVHPAACPLRQVRRGTPHHRPKRCEREFYHHDLRAPRAALGAPRSAVIAAALGLRAASGRGIPPFVNWEKTRPLPTATQDRARVRCLWWLSTARASISTSAPLGSPATATVERAGGSLAKNSP